MWEREKVTRFLLILNETYLSFYSKILTMEPMPSLGRIYQLAIQEESQHRIVDHGKGGDEMVLAARSHLCSSQRSTGGRGREAYLGFPDENPMFQENNRQSRFH